MNTKYNNLDLLLIAAVKGGTCTTGEMEQNQGISAEAARIIAPDVKNIFRVIEGRLQHLRKKGLICFSVENRQWTISRINP